MKTDFLKYILVLTFAAVSALVASAQENKESAGYDYADSLVYRTVPAVDSMLFGADVFAVMPSKSMGGNADVTIRQSQMVEESMKAHVEANKSRSLTGYRIRIFFDNSQSARVNSSRALDTFTSSFRGIPAYRSYANPYFKVTVGDFRTKSEAMELLSNIKGTFPSAFVVKENIAYPVVDKSNAYVVDTIKVL
jgi:hypothetical protein